MTVAQTVGVFHLRSRPPYNNVHYRRIVEAPGFEPITATSVAPLPPVVSDLEAIRQPSFDPNSPLDDLKYTVRFRLHNRLGIK